MEFGPVLKQFFDDPELLEKLLEFLRAEEEPLPVLAGYFAKACEALLSISPQQFLRVFYLERCHSSICQYLALSSLSELLLKVLCFSANYEEFYGYLTETLSVLIVKLKGSGNVMLMANTQQVLVRFIQNPNAAVPRNFKLFENYYMDLQASVDCPSMLRSLLCAPETLRLLFSNLDGNNSKGSAGIKANLQVLLTLFAKYAVAEGDDCTVIEMFAENIWRIHDVLRGTPTRFSDDKQVCMEIVRLLCSVNHHELYEKIVDSRILITITDIFERFPWSSVLHNSYLSIASAILICEPSLLRKHLLDDVKIANLIVKHGNCPMMKSKNCMIRKGFMGHLHTIANILLKLDDFDSYLEDVLDNTEGWYEFVSNVLVKQNFIENKQLGTENYAEFFDKLSSGDESEPAIEQFNILRTPKKSEENNPNAELPISNFEAGTKSEEINTRVSHKNAMEKGLETEEKFTDTNYWSIPIGECIEEL